MKKLFVILLLLITTIAFGEGRSNQWEKVRKAHLKIQPVCQICGTTKDLQVHHIIPFSFKPELELQDSNLITVCTSKYWGINCHSSVAHAGNFKYYNPWIMEDIAMIKTIANPQYIREHGTVDRDAYLAFIKARVKKYNLENPK